MDPTALLAVLVPFAALVGLVAGSVIDPVIDRIPAGGRLAPLVAGCPRCSAPLTGRLRVPLVWWSGLCPACGARLPARRLSVELLAAAAFASVPLRLGPSWAIPAFWVLAAVCIALALIDAGTSRLPNALTVGSYPWLAGLLVLAAVIDGSWGRLLGAAVGALALAGAYLLLVVINPNGMGFGDVKLAVLLGAGLGWLGWSTWVWGAVLPFLLMASVGIVLLVTGRAQLSTKIPFGPFMVVGAWVVILGGPLVGWG
jgi:leader peptidase (prepilin peptidase) / N-methyltransferase